MFISSRQSGIVSSIGLLIFIPAAFLQKYSVFIFGAIIFGIGIVLLALGGLRDGMNELEEARKRGGGPEKGKK